MTDHVETDHPEVPEHEKSIWEKPGTLKVIWVFLIASCGAAALGGFILAAQDKMHPHFTIDQFPAFYAVVGFVSFSFIVLAGQHLRKILMRDENYYNDDEGEET
ncbi:MAG: hypothetical protein AAF603_01625 [Pseudomonadota bacterium]